MVPSAALTSRNPYAYSLREQVPGIPDGDLNQPHGEEKSGEARPPLPQLLESLGNLPFEPFHSTTAIT